MTACGAFTRVLGCSQCLRTQRACTHASQISMRGSRRTDRERGVDGFRRHRAGLEILRMWAGRLSIASGERTYELLDWPFVPAYTRCTLSRAAACVFATTSKGL